MPTTGTNETLPSRSMQRVLALARPWAVGATLAFCLTASADGGGFWESLTNPTVNVTIEHPPALGLDVHRVAFGPATGECAEQFLDALLAQFVENGVEVTDREHLDAILAQHKLSFSGFVDQATAVEMGRILGPSALVFVKVARCTTERKTTRDEVSTFDYVKGQAVNRQRYTATTTGYFKGSVQVVDLSTGRIFSARQLDATEPLSNQALEQMPEFPSTFDALDAAMRTAVGEVHRLFFRWSESRELIFYDDKDCGLKVAAQLLAAGDSQGSIHQSRENLATCKQSPKTKPKLLARATYNLGIALFITGHHDSAIDYLTEALRLGVGETASTAIAECRRAQQLAAELRRVEERAELDDKRPSAKASPAAAAGDAEERLRRLDELRAKGLLSEKEYQRKRDEILADL